jgi:hypothetical protein
MPESALKIDTVAALLSASDDKVIGVLREKSDDVCCICFHYLKCALHRAGGMLDSNLMLAPIDWYHLQVVVDFVYYQTQLPTITIVFHCSMQTIDCHHSLGNLCFFWKHGERV